MNKYLISLIIIFFILGVLALSRNRGEAVKLITNPSPALTVFASPTQSEEMSATISPMQETDELVVEDLKVGTGAEAVAGKKVTVNYKGTLTDGTQFDSSYDRGVPFNFVLGAGEVIEGWDQGVAGMKVGGMRKLTIPPMLGYGAQAIGSIPANSTLIFEVELLEVE